MTSLQRLDHQLCGPLPPRHLDAGGLPNIAAQSQMAWMAQTKGDLEAQWFVPAETAVGHETAETVSRTQLLVGGAVFTQPAETAVGNASFISNSSFCRNCVSDSTACWRGGLMQRGR